MGIPFDWSLAMRHAALALAATLALPLDAEAAFLDATAGVTEAEARADVDHALTLGGQAGAPGYVGVFASAWLLRHLTLEGQLSLQTAGGGLTGHLPVAHGREYSHDLLVSVDGAYHHGWVDHHPVPGWLVGLTAGYGLLGPIDLRAQAGVVFLPHPTAGHAQRPTFGGVVRLGVPCL